MRFLHGLGAALAASVLLLGGADPERPFVDPMAGSGTLPIKKNPTRPAGSGSRDTAPPASSALTWLAKRNVQPSSL